MKEGEVVVTIKDIIAHGSAFRSGEATLYLDFECQEYDALGNLLTEKLSPGDEIITVENENVQESKMSTERVKALFMGPSGSFCNFEVKRSDGSREKMKLERGNVCLS
eukprot:765088-Hanusia_phi.AAC.6